MVFLIQNTQYRDAEAVQVKLDELLRGRAAGQTRIRVRYLDLATPWFDYLFVSRSELRGILRGTRWRIETIIDSRGPTYIAVLRKVPG